MAYVIEDHVSADNAPNGYEVRNVSNLPGARIYTTMQARTWLVIPGERS